VYKINHKAVLLAFVLQIVVAGVWFASTPLSFLGRSTLEEMAKQPAVGVTLLFALSTFVYLYFTAWLLGRVKGLSGVGQFFLTIGIWLFIALPNHIFVFINLHMNESDILYLLSYGAASSIIAAIILPLWRSSRSIFKD